MVCVGVVVFLAVLSKGRILCVFNLLDVLV